MSSNSLVAILEEDNSVTSSYVHWDGYATGVGEMLLENYNSEELARELATTLGYASSLYETVAKSQEGRANSDEPETYKTYDIFEEVIRDSSYLEYVYVWECHDNKWMVASWETTRKYSGNYEDHGFEFESHWNGFEDLVKVYIREGNETVKRYRKMVEEKKVGVEYLEYANELNTSIERMAA